MNIALGALIITLLLLPALFFRIGISLLSTLSHHVSTDGPIQEPKRKRKQRNRTYREMIRRNLTFLLAKLNFSEIVFLFLMIPLLLHWLSLLILHAFGRIIDYSLLFNLLASKADVLSGIGNEHFQQELLSFLKYIACECGIALMAGWIVAEMLVRCTRVAARWFLGTNIWFELFTGLVLPKKARLEVDLINVEVLCETKESSVIYSGILKKFDVDRGTGDLAYVTLLNAGKRDLRPGMQTVSDVTNTVRSSSVTTARTEALTAYSSKDTRILRIPGQYLTIKGAEIVNVNLIYQKYSWKKDETGNWQADRIEQVTTDE
jgi:hypothetical protein